MISPVEGKACPLKSYMLCYTFKLPFQNKCTIVKIITTQTKSQQKLQFRRVNFWLLRCKLTVIQQFLKPTLIYGPFSISCLHIVIKVCLMYVRSCTFTRVRKWPSNITLESQSSTKDRECCSGMLPTVIVSVWYFKIDLKFASQTEIT